MDPLRFRVPFVRERGERAAEIAGAVSSIPQLLARCLGRDADELASLLAAAPLARVDGRPAKGRARGLPGGSLIELELPSGLLPVESEEPATGFLALVPALPWAAGALEGRGGRSLAFERRARRGGVDELVLRSEVPLQPGAAAAVLAGAGLPVLGDLRRGGFAVAGGLRLVAVADAAAETPDADRVWQRRAGEPAAPWWPEAIDIHAHRVRDGAGHPPAWHVSAATARVVERGHPWILRDDETEATRSFAPGCLVKVVAPGGATLGLARIEGEGRLAARIWTTGVGRGRESESVEGRVIAALARRRGLLQTVATAPAGEAATTDCLRLIHGEADGLPGLAVDRFGAALRVLVTGQACLHLVPRVVDVLRGRLAPALGTEPAIVEVLHLRDAPRGALECVRSCGGDLDALAAGGPAAPASLVRPLRVWERGLAHWVDLGLGDPTRPRPGVGLFLDQRDNRERLAKQARRGGHWLNLFAHTGAFSLALLAGGAEAVTSVDLSAAYLAWLEENLALNAERGVDASRHESVRRDGRRYLDQLAPGERFAGIVIDPPTAAAAGRRFWSVHKDLEPLIASALRHLEPGGVLLVCQNQRRARPSLGEVLKRVARRERCSLTRVEPAPPSPDFPALRGFAEGDAFEGVLAQRGDGG